MGGNRFDPRKVRIPVPLKNLSLASKNLTSKGQRKYKKKSWFWQDKHQETQLTESLNNAILSRLPASFLWWEILLCKTVACVYNWHEVVLIKKGENFYYQYLMHYWVLLKYLTKKLIRHLQQLGIFIPKCRLYLAEEDFFSRVQPLLT